MATINKATPRAYHKGFRDESVPNQVVEQEQVAIHTPVFFFQGPDGPNTPELLAFSAAQKLYGNEIGIQSSKYFSHQLFGAMVNSAEGGQAIFLRVQDDKAKKARVRLSVEVIPQSGDRYERDPVTFKPIPDGKGGFKIEDGKSQDYVEYRWFAEPITEDEMGQATVVSPGPTSGSRGDSKIYPIRELEVPYVGVGGNNKGVRFSVPTSTSRDPADALAAREAKSGFLRIACVMRKDRFSTPYLVRTQKGADFVDMGWDGTITNPKTGRRYSTEDATTAYERNKPGLAKVSPIVGAQHVYLDNINALRAELKLLEDTNRADYSNADQIEKSEINIFNGIGFEGEIQYFGRPHKNSLKFDGRTTLYFRNGTDGDVSEEKLAELVKNRLETVWTDPEGPLLDRLRFPISNMYDTGFPIDVKRLMMAQLSKRPDFGVDVCTQDLSLPDYDLATESSVYAMLNAAAALTPESEINGTPMVRAGIWQHMGNHPLDTEGRRYPAIMDIIAKRAATLGAGDGKIKKTNHYDRPPNNQISGMTNLTNTWANDLVSDEAYAASANYVRFKGRKDLYWPVFQTVYNNPSSILNGDMVRAIMTDLVKIQDRVHAEISGSDDTKANIIEESERLFNEYTADKYAGRVTIENRAYFTPADDARGYTWTMDTVVYSDPQKTAASFNLIARRRVEE